MDVRREMRAAKLLYQSGRYQEALDVLAGIPTQESYDAQIRIREEMLSGHKRKPKTYPPTGHEVLHAATPNAVINIVNNVNGPRGCMADVPQVALFVIVGNLVAWSFAFGIQAAAIEPLAGIGAITAFLIGGLVYIVISYIIWKTFWWFMAISMTVMTILFIMGISDLNTMIAASM